MHTTGRNLHLGTSAIIIISVGLIYGLNPNKILPSIFDFTVESLELKNIFRATMGLYFSFAVYWIIGIVKPKHWKGATIFNVVFMGGLAFGKILSTLFDGVSFQYGIGLLLELMFMSWGIYNLKMDEA